MKGNISNNNPTDLISYNKFREKQLRLFKQVKPEVEISRINENLDQWKRSLEWPWDQADLKFFVNEVKLNFVKQRNLDGEKKLSSFVIIGKQQTGKTFLMYALINEYLKSGLITPSQIRITNANEGAMNINGMFASREWKDKFFNKNVKLFVIEGCSKDFTDLGLKQYEQFMTEFNEFIRLNNAAYIIVYNESINEETIKKGLTIPRLVKNEKIKNELIAPAGILKIDKVSREKNEKYLKQEN